MHARHPRMLGEAVSSRGSVQDAAERRARASRQVPPDDRRARAHRRTVPPSADRRSVALFAIPRSNDHVWAADYLHAGWFCEALSLLCGIV